MKEGKTLYSNISLKGEYPDDVLPLSVPCVSLGESRTEDVWVVPPERKSEGTDHFLGKCRVILGCVGDTCTDGGSG